jgi:DNA transformation protein
VERRKARADPPVLTELLGAPSPLGVRARGMFGGHGLYLGDKFFGLVYDGHVYFRTDEFSRPDYTSRGMPPFQPNNRPIGPRTVPRNFQVPPDVLADSELLAEWALRASQTP